MRSSLRILVAFLAIACHGALAQTPVPPSVTVQQLAPQLVAFAGSQSNFQNLVTGLAQGTPVQLITVLPDGFTQVVTFTPTAPMSPTAIAQTLETARQQLIGLGIGNPTAEQIGIALMGGIVPTAIGGSQVPGVLNAQTPPSPAVQIQSAAAAGATTSTSPSAAAAGATTSTSPAAAAAGTPTATVPGVTNAVNVQIFPTVPSTPATGAAAAAAPPRVNTSDSFAPAGVTSRSPLPSATSTTPPATSPTPAPARPFGTQPAQVTGPR
jgi:hypothetical protein